MARLPVPGSDDNSWGTILNDYLSQAHDAAGNLKANSVPETALDGAVRTKLNSTPTVTGATTTTRGTVMLAGDLAGTADAPTVPLAVKTIGGGREDVTTGISSGTYSVDLNSANVFSVTLNANTTFTFTGATAGKACSFTLYIKQDATGSRTVTWPSSAKWSGGTPVLSTNANAVDIVVFETIDAGTTWFGSLIGTNFA